MKKLSFLFLSLLLLSACSGNKRDKAYLHEDDVKFAADNCFQPIVQELSDLYSLRKPEATMLPTYCSEDSVVRLLLRDSVRLAITTRTLSEREKRVVTAQHRLPLFESRIAYDAFALIVNKNCQDSTINLREIKDIITGRITNWQQLEGSNGMKGKISLLFDASGSSTLRYMRDSLNGGKDLKGNIYAQGSNQSVIEAVKRDPRVIGVVSTDWLRVSKGDTVAMNSFRNLDVRVMHVGKQGLKAKDWARPLQYHIATGAYPLIRSVYVITTDPRVRSTLKSFYFFLKEDAAQLVISNSSQLLTKNPVQVRDVNIKD